MAGLPARDRGRPLRDRRDGQGRRPLLLLPADQACCATPCRPGCRWSASTSATPTWCRSTTSPRRWTTSPTCPASTARRSTWSTPSRSRSSRWSTPSARAAGAPRFATPVDRGSPRAAARPAPPARCGPLAWSARPGPHARRPSCCSTRPSAGSASRPRCSRTSSFPPGLRLPPHREGAGRLRHRRARPRVVRRAPCGATGRSTSTGPPRHDAGDARGARPGKYVVITGASSGHRPGHRAQGRPGRRHPGPGRARQGQARGRPGPTIESRGGTAHVYACDLSDLEAIDALCDAAHRRPADASTSSSTTPAARSGARCGSRRTASTTSSAPCSSTTSARSGW